MSTILIKQKNAYNYIINFNTYNREKKKYKNLKKKIIELYSGKKSTDVGTDEEKISV